MNKKLFSLFIISPILFSSCSTMWSSRNSNSVFEPVESDTDSQSEEPAAVEFNIVSAQFIDNECHLRVQYTCNYPTPFNVTGHPFNKLNITGVLASEIDYSHDGYFTLLSPIINTTLKFEFYDTNNIVYISLRYTNVVLYNEENPTPVIDYPNGYSTLYWSDEFNGDALDTSKWTYEIGNGSWGWGNNEAQYYTNQNDFVSDGVLTIRGKKESIDGYSYTSTRIKTENKVKFTYGYVEARIALPAITGMWPAFWMMPNDSIYGGWPHSGEIDIMEARGRVRYASSSAIHFSTSEVDHTYLTDEKSGHDIAEFHKYAVEWKQDTISFYIDDVCYFTNTKEQWTTKYANGSETAPFDKDFYIILNLAIGGNFDGGQVPPSSFNSADMKIDYVRVFK